MNIYFTLSLDYYLQCDLGLDFVKQAVTEIPLGRSMIICGMCAVRIECCTLISFGVMMHRNCMSSGDVKCIYAKVDKSM